MARSRAKENLAVTSLPGGRGRARRYVAIIVALAVCAIGLTFIEPRTEEAPARVVLVEEVSEDRVSRADDLQVDDIISKANVRRVLEVIAQGKKIPSDWEAVERMHNELVLQSHAIPSLDRTRVELTYEGSADLGIDLVNGLAKQYVLLAQRRAAALGDQQGKYLARRVAESQDQVALLESQIEEVEFALSLQAESLAEPPPSQRETVPVIETPQQTPRPDPQTEALTAQIAEKYRIRAQLLERMTESHPRVVELDSEIASLEAKRATVAGPQEIIMPAPIVEEATEAEADEAAKLAAAESAKRLAMLEGALTEARETHTENVAAHQAHRSRVAEAPAPQPPVYVESWAKAVPPEYYLPWPLVAGVVVLALGGALAVWHAIPADSTLTSIRQIERFVGVPVTGLMPATERTPPLPPLELPKGLRTVKIASEVVVTVFVFSAVLLAVTQSDFLPQLLSQPMLAASDTLPRAVAVLRGQ